MEIRWKKLLVVAINIAEKKTHATIGSRYCSWPNVGTIVFSNSHTSILALKRLWLFGPWVRKKTIVADAEFDAEERFHDKVIGLGGKGVAPLRHKNIPVHRTKGSRRKQLRRKWPGRSYNRRPLTETTNSMLKRGMGETLRGKTLGMQARHFYMKCFTHNLLLRCC